MRPKAASFLGTNYFFKEQVQSYVDWKNHTTNLKKDNVKSKE